MSGTLRRLARGTGIVLAGNGASALLGFLSFVLLARTLSPAEFGTVAPMVSILDLSQIFMDMVIGGGTLLTAGRYLKSDPNRAAMTFKLALAMRVAVAGAVLAAGWICAGWLSSLLFADHSRIWELRWSFLGVLGVAIYTACVSVLQARQQFVRLSLTLLYKNTLRLAAIAALAGLGALSVSSAIYAIAGAILVAAVVSALTTDIGFLRIPGFDRALLRDLIRSNKWMLLLLLVLVLGARMDVFMLTSLSNAEEVGRYAAAFQLSGVVAILSQSLITTLFPEVATYTERAQLRRYVSRYLKLAPLALLPVALLILAGPWVVELLLGNKYAGAIPVFRVLLILSFLTMLSNPLLMAMFPLGKVHALALMNLGQTVARIGLNLAFMPTFGAIGAALVDLGTKIALVLVAVAYLLWQLSSRERDRANEA